MGPTPRHMQASGSSAPPILSEVSLCFRVAMECVVDVCSTHGGTAAVLASDHLSTNTIAHIQTRPNHAEQNAPALATAPGPVQLG